MNQITPGLSDVIEALCNQYEIVGPPLRLSVLKDSLGEQKLFDSLLALYRPEFASNQRILVVQDTSEIYSYPENFASDALIWLQKSVQMIDISNFFVIVISGNSQIEKELHWVQQHYSTDDRSMHGYWVDIPYERQDLVQDTFCALPWMHLHVTTQLDVAPCCQADQTKPWGNLEKHSVMDIINSQQANQMRLKMLAGVPCRECHNCYTMERNGQESQRIITNKKYNHLKQDFAKQTNTDGSISTFKPLGLDLRLNNTCNLKCRTCDGRASSQIAYEEKKLFNDSTNLDRIPTRLSRSRVLDKVIGFLDHANTIYFAGGEPLLMHEHFAILEHLIRLGKTDVRLAYNTNFTLPRYKDKNIFDIWKLFDNVRLSASLDGHGAVFEYVRHGASWPEVEQNLLTLRQQCPHVQFQVFSTISVFSAESVMELQQKWHQSNMLDIRHFQLNPVSVNEFYSLCTLFAHHKTYLSKKIDNHVDWLMSVEAVQLAADWRTFQKTMWKHDKKYLSLMIASVNQARDIERKENFQSLFPQFADLFGTVDARSQFNFVGHRQ
jgi:MoaA/NifB/PqqE/SkfB family radical SAM enzyme